MLCAQRLPSFLGSLCDDKQPATFLSSSLFILPELLGRLRLFSHLLFYLSSYHFSYPTHRYYLYLLLVT